MNRLYEAELHGRPGLGTGVLRESLDRPKARPADQGEAWYGVHMVISVRRLLEQEVRGVLLMADDRSVP